MRLSNGTPVQFWLNGQETFNEKVVPGVQQTNFNQIFRPDDNVVIQFTDTLLFGYQLNILDMNGDILQTLPFTITPIDDNYVYSLNFTFDDYSITGLVTLTISYFIYQLSGGVDGLLGDVSGTAINTASFLISGSVEGLIGTVTGDIENGIDVYIDNDTSTGSLSVTGITFSDATLTPPTFPPILGGFDLNGKINIGGTNTVTVSITVDTPAHSIEITDSELNSSCQTITASGNYVFSGIVCNTSNPITIIISEGSC
jgi:hypothetical protein